MTKISKIETSYGEFETLIHFERYWEDKVSKAFRDGFEQGKTYFQKERLHHRINPVEQECDKCKHRNGDHTLGGYCKPCGKECWD